MSATRPVRTARRRLAAAGVGGLLLLSFTACDRAPAERDRPAPAPPSGLDYVPPAPGSYRLPPIQPAADGAVLAADGTRHRLSDYLGDRLVVLSFVYARCHQAQGCPMALAVFQRLHRRLGEDPELADRVRLVTLSFDPDRDTPEVMRSLAAAFAAGGEAERDRWALLTTASAAELRPILDGYGQYIVRERDETGRWTGDFSHVLKVFLIDRRLRVRNIYSTGFLHPELVINDLETLILEEESAG